MRAYIPLVLAVLFLAGTAQAEDTPPIPDLSKFQVHERCLDAKSSPPRFAVDRYQLSATDDVYFNVYVIVGTVLPAKPKFVETYIVSAMARARRFEADLGDGLRAVSPEEYWKLFAAHMPRDYFDTEEHFRSAFRCQPVISL